LPFLDERHRRLFAASEGARYGHARLQITADVGGSDGSRLCLWKWELLKLADEIGLDIAVCRFTPGTSKWNKIEHRLFSFISREWQARPLVICKVIIELIAATTTTTGLTVHCELDRGDYPKGITVSDAQTATIRITPTKSTASGATPSRRYKNRLDYFLAEPLSRPDREKPWNQVRRAGAAPACACRDGS
jgi:hypothetical protein